MMFTQAFAWFVLIMTALFIFYTSKNEKRNEIFKASPFNILLRVAGSFLYLMVLNGWFEGTAIGNMILDPNTGGLMAGEGGLLTTLYITFFVGILALPLLTHFGIVSFWECYWGLSWRKSSVCQVIPPWMPSLLLWEMEPSASC